MSRNLVELIRRHHAVDAPTALEVLKEAMDEHGEITDDDRRRAAEVSGLPEAAVYGVSTFYDDLLAPRGARHVRVCTGTACFAADRRRARRAVERGARAVARRAQRRRLGLARRDRLPRLLPLLPGDPRRRRRSTPARTRSSGRSPAASGPPAEPEWAEPARRAGADPARRLVGAAPGADRARTRSGCSTRSRPPRSAAAAAPASRPAPSGRFARAGRRARRSSSSPTATRATPAPTSTST